jgi:hypothetical protein
MPSKKPDDRQQAKNSKKTVNYSKRHLQLKTTDWYSEAAEKIGITSTRAACPSSKMYLAWESGGR